MSVIRGELDQETAALKSTAAAACAFLERRRPSSERARRYHLGRRVFWEPFLGSRASHADRGGLLGPTKVFGRRRGVGLPFLS